MRRSTLGLLLAGCTTMTVHNPPDARFERDAMMDAGPDAPLPPPTIDTCTAEGMDATLGEACTADAECDDGCYCNGVERCEEGVCAAGSDPCVDTVDCTADVCLEEVDRCFHDPRHELCSNGLACDGLERCDLVDGCGPGVPPYCNDETSCTVDSCDDAIGCVFVARDLDGDGHTDGRCGGQDCDDDPRFGSAIHPGAPEDCMNRRDDDCDGMRDYLDSECIPTNDTCDSAVFLPGPGTYSGSTATLAGDYTLGCRAIGPDSVFRFELEEPQDVTVTVSGGGNGAGVALRPWGACATGPDEKCNNFSPPSVLRRSLPAGEWAIIVQSNGSGAAFDLVLRYGEPTEVPPIDVCDAQTLDLCAGAPCEPMTASFTGMFVETEDDYQLSCAGSNERRDAAYRFTLDRPMDVRLTASSGTASWIATYLALTTDCSVRAAERRCVASSSAELRQRKLAPGTYYVLLESGEVNAPGWTLNAEFAEPTPRNDGDACSAPIDISEATLGEGGMGSVPAAMLDLDSGVSCGGGTTSYRDATFMFTLPVVRDVTLTTQASSSHYASLQTACGDGRSDLRCWSGSGTVSQSWRSLPAGTYYATVSTTTSIGNVTAGLQTREATEVPPNERCAGALELTSGTSRRDTTVGFEDDGPGGSCAGTGRPDVFYTFTLDEPRDVVISVRDADDTPTIFYVTLRDSCESGSRVLACASTTGTPAAASINQNLDAGTYIVMVESAATATSDYRIFATFYEP